MSTRDLQSLHQLLKASTSSAHVKIESNPRLRRLLSSDLTVDEYRGILAKYYGFYLPLETALVSALEEHGRLRDLLPDAESRWKAPSLQSDLQVLGFSERELARLPVCERAPRLLYREGYLGPASPGRVLGVLYVTEGSTLGGQLISRHLTKTFPFTTSECLAFFSNDPQKTSERWKSFLFALSASDLDISERQEALAAANETFSLLDAWMSETSG